MYQRQNRSAGDNDVPFGRLEHLRLNFDPKFSLLGV